VERRLVEEARVGETIPTTTTASGQPVGGGYPVREPREGEVPGQFGVSEEVSLSQGRDIPAQPGEQKASGESGGVQVSEPTRDVEEAAEQSCREEAVEQPEGDEGISDKGEHDSSIEDEDDEWETLGEWSILTDPAAMSWADVSRDAPEFGESDKKEEEHLVKQEAASSEELKERAHP
jgi:hypothetical protein